MRNNHILLWRWKKKGKVGNSVDTRHFILPSVLGSSLISIKNTELKYKSIHLMQKYAPNFDLLSKPFNTGECCSFNSKWSYHVSNSKVFIFQKGILIYQAHLFAPNGSSFCLKVTEIRQNAQSSSNYLECFVTTMCLVLVPQSECYYNSSSKAIFHIL